MTNEYNPDGKEIRFIDSHYKDLFHIPDGSCVQIHYPDEMVVKPCTFIDEYHTQIGYNVFHICQFAEIMERNGASYMPEPEIMGDEAAWKVGKDRILAVQTCEDGYDYTLLDENYNEIDGGQVDNPELSMLEVRRDILESFGLERRELRAMFYEDVMEQAFEVGRQAVVVNDPIAELAFKLDRFAENFDPYGQAVVCPVPWVKADDIVVAFHIFPFLVFLIAEIGSHTGNSEILAPAVEGRNAVILPRYQPPVFIKGGFHGKLVMLKCEIGFRCAIVGVFRADMFECCQQRHPLSARLQTLGQQGRKPPPVPPRQAADRDCATRSASGLSGLSCRRSCRIRRSASRQRQAARH